jgi:hypothetical protein
MPESLLAAHTLAYVWAAERASKNKEEPTLDCPLLVLIGSEVQRGNDVILLWLPIRSVSTVLSTTGGIVSVDSALNRSYS